MADNGAATAAAQPAGQVGTWTDPYRSYNFKLDVGNGVEGHFTECSGLAVKVQTISYREAGLGLTVHKVPGPVEYADVTLRYGLTSSPALWEWFLKTLQGHVERRNISIAILGDDGATPVVQWNLIQAWPSAWRGAPLNAMGREIAIESVTLTFESLERG
jgi:phage tail-like protein